MIIHFLPPIYAKDTGKTRKRKMPAIPSLQSKKGDGTRKYSNIVASGFLWMLMNGHRNIDISKRFGVASSWLCKLRSGATRPHCVPREPDEVFWAEIESMGIDRVQP